MGIPGTEERSPLSCPSFRTMWAANLASNFGSMVQLVGAAAHDRARAGFHQPAHRPIRLARSGDRRHQRHEARDALGTGVSVPGVGSVGAAGMAWWSARSVTQELPAHREDHLGEKAQQPRAPTIVATVDSGDDGNPRVTIIRMRLLLQTICFWRPRPERKTSKLPGENAVLRPDYGQIPRRALDKWTDADGNPWNNQALPPTSRSRTHRPLLLTGARSQTALASVCYHFSPLISSSHSIVGERRGRCRRQKPSR
jgi:hypothetical protein